MNISSASALISPQGYCPYGLAKAAIHKFTEDCVVQVPGVRHNTIMPGFIETAILLDAYGEEATAQIAGVGGMARLNTAVSTLAGEVQPVTQN